MLTHDAWCIAICYAGLYGTQKRDDYTEDDVEQYFNYMGMLAEEANYIQSFRPI